MQLSANVPSQAEASLSQQTPGRGPSVFSMSPQAKTKMAGTSPAITKQCCQLNSKRSLQSILGLVDQRALLDPGHHVAQLSADVLDRMGGEFCARGLERGLVDLVLQHP